MGLTGEPVADGSRSGAMTQGGGPSFGQQQQRGRMQSGASPCRIPCPELVAAPTMADPDEHDIAGADPDLLRALCCLEIGESHVVARLQP